MKDLIRKLTSRKLWGCVIGVLLGVALARGVPPEQIGKISETVQQIIGYMGSILTCVAYIYSEGKVDAAGAANGKFIGQLEAMFAGLIKGAGNEGKQREKPAETGGEERGPGD